MGSVSVDSRNLRPNFLDAGMAISPQSFPHSLICAAVGVALGLHGPSARAIQIDPHQTPLSSLSLEELSSIEITSVSKTPQRLHTAAAAVTVITGEDIRRSGATTVPDALRFVPGLTVAQQTSSSWAVSARGFSSINSEKLLVLSDTRSVYTPLVSGVAWDVQNYLMHDIERIEVIRGPGATLWGSNAVNGVINITTKSAHDTQGLYTELAAGTEDRVNVAARYGATDGNGVSYRVFGKYVDRDSSSSSIATSDDDWHLGHAGFRTDWSSTDADSVTVQGDIYRGTIGRLIPAVIVLNRDGPTGDLETEVSGGNILGRWQHQLDADSNFVLRAYYDNTRRDDPSFRDRLNTLDIDFQHQFVIAGRHELLWGVNYRTTDNRNVSKGIFNLDPDDATDELYSAFVQDRIVLTDTFNVTLGTKYEHNDFSGTEFQPGARAAWQFTPSQMLWVAASRAVRVPTRFERDIAVDASDPLGNPVFRLSGNRAFESEVLKAYEIGYRWQAAANLSVDLAAFRNRYDGLASVEIGNPYLDPGGRTIIPVLNENATNGVTQGAEAQINYAPLQNWRLMMNYSYFTMQLDPTGLDINRGKFYEGATPRHQFGLRSMLDLPKGVQLDVQYRYQSAIEHLPEIISGEGISSYSELDLRLAKRLTSQVEVSLVARNLLHSEHVEFGAPASRGEIERAVYAKVAYGF